MSATIIQFPEHRIVREAPEHFDMFRRALEFACEDCPDRSFGDQLANALRIERVARSVEKHIAKQQSKKVPA